MAIVSKKVQDLPEVSSPENFEIPGFDIQTNFAAKAKMSDLKGNVGATPNITITAQSIPNGQPAEVIKTGTPENPNFQLRIPNAKDGENAPSAMRQYSQDGTTWHENYVSGDLFYRISDDSGNTWGNAIPLNINEAISKWIKAEVSDANAPDMYFQNISDTTTIISIDLNKISWKKQVIPSPVLSNVQGSASYGNGVYIFCDGSHVYTTIDFISFNELLEVNNYAYCLFADGVFTVAANGSIWKSENVIENNPNIIFNKEVDFIADNGSCYGLNSGLSGNSESYYAIFDDANNGTFKVAYKTDINGTWTDVTGNLPQSNIFSGVAVLNGVCYVSIVGTLGTSLYYSNVGSTTWTAIDNIVQSLGVAQSPDGKILVYSQQNGITIYKGDNSGFTQFANYPYDHANNNISQISYHNVANVTTFGTQEACYIVEGSGTPTKIDNSDNVGSQAQAMKSAGVGIFYAYNSSSSYSLISGLLQPIPTTGSFTIENLPFSLEGCVFEQKGDLATIKGNVSDKSINITSISVTETFPMSIKFIFKNK